MRIVWKFLKRNKAISLSVLALSTMMLVVHQGLSLPLPAREPGMQIYLFLVQNLAHLKISIPSLLKFQDDKCLSVPMQVEVLFVHWDTPVSIYFAAAVSSSAVLCTKPHSVYKHIPRFTFLLLPVILLAKWKTHTHTLKAKQLFESHSIWFECIFNKWITAPELAPSSNKWAAPF